MGYFYDSKMIEYSQISSRGEFLPFKTSMVVGQILPVNTYLILIANQNLIQIVDRSKKNLLHILAFVQNLETTYT